MLEMLVRLVAGWVVLSCVMVLGWCVLLARFRRAIQDDHAALVRALRTSDQRAA